MSDGITLRFVRAGDIVSLGISVFEYGYWATHVEALMPDGTLLGAHFRGGVLARPRGYDAAKLRREEFVIVQATQAEADSFHGFLRDQLDKPYDTFAIAGIVVQRDWRSPNKWFCSELIGAALCACGKFPAHLASRMNHVTPRDVLLIVSGQVLVKQ